MINPSYIKNASVEPFPDIKPWQKVVAKIKASIVIFFWQLTNYCSKCRAKMRPTSMSGTNGGANNAAD